MFSFRGLAHPRLDRIRSMFPISNPVNTKHARMRCTRCVQTRPRCTRFCTRFVRTNFVDGPLRETFCQRYEYVGWGRGRGRKDKSAACRIRRRGRTFNTSATVDASIPSAGALEFSDGRVGTAIGDRRMTRKDCTHQRSPVQEKRIKNRQSYTSVFIPAKADTGRQACCIVRTSKFA